MSFWGTEETNKETQIEIGGFSLIPDNTLAQAFIKDVGWDATEYEPDEVIKVQWKILKPEEYAGTVIFQKIRVNSEVEKKAKHAIKMLAAIDNNTGNKLDRSKKPSTQDLYAAFFNRIMTVKVNVWEINDKTGNWIGAVYPKDKYEDQPVVKEVQPEDIPF